MDVGVISELYDTKEQAFEAGKSVGRLDLDDWAKKRIAELEAALSALVEHVDADILDVDDRLDDLIAGARAVLTKST